MYATRVEQFFDKILHVKMWQPLMARYLEGYFDLFWIYIWALG